jgi:hypothetical protein
MKPWSLLGHKDIRNTQVYTVCILTFKLLKMDATPTYLVMFLLGYARSFAFSGEYTDTTEIRGKDIRNRTFVAMDATVYNNLGVIYINI